MAKGYWVARVDVSDVDRYRGYVAANAAAFKQFGAKFLVRAGAFENPEGTARSRNVVIEFPSYQAALDCYASPVLTRQPRKSACRCPASTSRRRLLQPSSVLRSR